MFFKNQEVVYFQGRLSHDQSRNLRHSAAWLAQLGERRSTEREVVGSNPSRTNTQGL